MAEEKFWLRRHPKIELAIPKGLLMKRIFIAAVLLCLTTTVAAERLDAQSPEIDARSAIARFAQNLQCFEAEFTQQLLDERGRVLESSSGMVQFSLPNQYRWHYREPYEQIIVGDGEFLWVYDVDLWQVSRKPQEEAPNALQYLLQPDMLNQDHALSSELLEDGGVQVMVTPLDSEAGFDELRFVLHGEHLQSIHLTDALGQISKLNFMMPKRNPDLPADLFQFEPPKHADVIGFSRESNP
jgi:outer membrane lipoprotein carrier protein